MTRTAELLPEFGVLRPDLPAYEVARALKIQNNVLKARELGLESSQESLLASFTVRSPVKPCPSKPKLKRQRVPSQPTRCSSRLAVSTAISYTESPVQPTKTTAVMPRQSPPSHAVPEPAELWEAHLNAYSLTATAARAPKNNSVAAWLTTNEYFIADLRMYSEADVTAAADKLAADLPLAEGSKLAYRAALLALRAPGDSQELESVPAHNHTHGAAATCCSRD